MRFSTNRKGNTTQKEMRNVKRSHRILALFFNVIMLNALLPYNMLYANNNGPNSPEAAGFEPVDATDMVNLSTGDLSYVLPLLDVGGFPVNLSYHAGITQDMDASWVGLGWYLNTGAINRSITNTPDDWNGGVGINFTNYTRSENYYGVTVDLGFPAGGSVGVGMNWGGGKGLSGSVSASAHLLKLGGMVDAGSGSAAISTTGSVSLGVGASIGSIGGGASVGYNLSSGESSYGGGVGVSMGNNSFVGGSLSSNGGFSINAGQNYKTDKGNSTHSGVGIGASSFSSGDYSVEQQSTAVALPLHVIGIPLTLGFSHTRVKFSLSKAFKNQSWGALYSGKSAIRANGQVYSYNQEFTDYQDRTRSMDVYSTRLPQPEEEFIGDNSKEIENINFTFLGYDNYNVAAQGINGSISPKIFQNITLVGKGERTQNMQGEDIHAFYHYGRFGSQNNAQREFGKNLNSSSSDYDDLYFYFDGQINSRDVVNNSVGRNDLISGSYKEINDFLSGGGYTTNYNNSRKRSRTPSYIQVFTNRQIQSGYARVKGLITPSNISDADRTNNALFDPSGIGAYMITSPDGKTYHFSLPVYHFEQVHRNLIKDSESFDGRASNISEKRQYSKYATHWLLTAITGADFVNNNSPKLDDTDYGYWVEMEYGKWSDGFVWRTPYEKGTYNYNTNIKGEIGTEDKGNYSFGRKQLYYLDKIITRKQTAIFVKDIRKDAAGQAVKFASLAGSSVTGKLTSSGGNNALNRTANNVEVYESNVSYLREYSLGLKRIILLKSDVAQNLSKSQGNNLGQNLPGINTTTHYPGWQSSDFRQAYSDNFSYKLHQQNNVFDVNDIQESFIANNALKVIEFDQNYDLAQNSPSSPKELFPVSQNGKLSLNAITFKGRGGSTYMPPYRFDYSQKTLKNISESDFSGSSAQLYQAKKNAIDSWGFLKGVDAYGNSKATAWSLNKITTPAGGEISINYEEDDYWIEAFSRRYWKDSQLEYRFYSQFTSVSNSDIRFLEFRRDPNDFSAANIYFDKYFRTGDKAFLDVVYYRNTKKANDKKYIHVSGSYPVTYVDENIVRFQLPSNDTNTGTRGPSNCSQSPWLSSQGYHLITGWQNFELGASYCSAGGSDENLRKYKLVASKVPEDETGGGLRVKSLETKDFSNATYRVEYDYGFPQGHNKYGRSSGITSYSPKQGIQYVPYQSELPEPGVMYEYVTMTEKTNYGEYDAKTRYRFNVLKPIFNIFNPNIEMEAQDTNASEDRIFWAKVTPSSKLNGSNEKKISAKNIDVHLNTALLGQIKSVETLNSFNQVMFKTVNEYVNGEILTGSKPRYNPANGTVQSSGTYDSGSQKPQMQAYAEDPYSANPNRIQDPNDELEPYPDPGYPGDPNPTYYYDYSDADYNKGYVRESFNSMKSIFRTNNNGENPVIKERLLSISSKTEYTNMLKRVHTYSGGQKGTVTYSDVDPWLSSFRKSETTLADGTKVISTRVPAYEKYSAMQSKVVNENNRNMLSQEVMNMSYLENGGLINASISTWNPDWDYRFSDGSLESTNQRPVWRKHKNYVWRGELNADGTYQDNIKSNAHFDFINGVPRDGFENNWLNISEITAYNHYSAPLEMRDINSNYMGTVLDTKNQLTMASGNAKNTELFYYGAEVHSLNGRVGGDEFRNSAKAHTGSYSLSPNSTSDHLFEINRTSTQAANELRQGMYKVSFWSTGPAGKLYYKGALIEPVENVYADCWHLYNYYINYTGGAFNLYVTGTSLSNFDDFRMHPVETAMTSYVYDPLTDDLIAILNSNNLGTAFSYDKAGRLEMSFKEVSAYQNSYGGFRLLKRYRYKYKLESETGETENSSSNYNNCPCSNWL